MNCFYHEDKVAVAQCQDCGVGLCRACAERYSRPTCQRCVERAQQQAEATRENAQRQAEADYKSEYLAAKKRNKKTLKTFIVFAVCIFLIGIMIGSALSDPMWAVMGLFVSPLFAFVLTAFPAGWRASAKILSGFKFILILPIAGWIIYFFVRLMFAGVCGYVALPVEISKDRKIIKEYEKSHPEVK